MAVTNSDANKDFFQAKGFDISTPDGLKGAKDWICSAGPNDMFYSEVPDEEADPVDLMMGEMRKVMLQDYLEKL